MVESPTGRRALLNPRAVPDIDLTLSSDEEEDQETSSAGSSRLSRKPLVLNTDSEEDEIDREDLRARSVAAPDASKEEEEEESDKLENESTEPGPPLFIKNERIKRTEMLENIGDSDDSCEHIDKDDREEEDRSAGGDQFFVRTPRPYSSRSYSSSNSSDNSSPISIKKCAETRENEENDISSNTFGFATDSRDGTSVSIDQDVDDAEKLAERFESMGIRNSSSSNTAVAAFREALDIADIEVDEEELEEVPPPPHLVCKLLPHQIDSLRWLKSRESGEGLNHGGLLADDMGLGKTVQMLALILSNPFDPDNEEVDTMKTTLIVAPVGLLEQWKLEVSNKTKKYLRVGVYHGAARKTLAKKLHLYDVIVTNYETVSSDKNSASGLFDSKLKPFHRLILDETHTIKNHKTKKAVACSEVKARFRWALTGTPIQNSVDDLFSIFKFLGKRVVPRSLWSNVDFDQWIGTPVKSKQNELGFERLASILSGIMKRRTKNTTVNGKPILPLPERIVNVVRLDFVDPSEREFYESLEKLMISQYKEMQKGDNTREETIQILVKLLRMRQAALHPALVTKTSVELDADALDPTIKSNSEDDGGTNMQVNASGSSCTLCQEPRDPNNANFCSSCAAGFERFEGLQPSTKITKTMQLLQQFRNETKGLDENGKKKPKKKVIIFSSFTSVLLLLEKFLQKGGYGFVRFDGSCSLTKKNAAVEAITNDPNITIILISIKAGAVGLNLTMCSRVILLDLWWNPAIENHAHRYGQKEDVEIYKLVVNDTVEDRILQIQEFQADLATSALEGGGATKVKLTQRERDFLFTGITKKRR
ncbi:hypothetical protein JCM3765_004403 [Sporobolomyces pararoseus]